MNDVGVGMIRTHMGEIPQYVFAPGLTSRPFKDGDEESWVRIQGAANAKISEVAMETFNNDFGEHLDKLADRSWFVVARDGEDDEGEEIASITAWWEENVEGVRGLIHWVAVLPKCQGRGVGKGMMTLAMNRLAKSHDSAYLRTSTARLPAIKLYLDFGFSPDMEMENADMAWKQVRFGLEHPALGNG